MNALHRTRIALALAGVVALLAALLGVGNGRAGAETDKPIAAPSWIAIEDQFGDVRLCTLTAIGWDKANTNNPRGITSGHCADSWGSGHKVYLSSGPSVEQTDFSRQIGTVLKVLKKTEGDASLIRFEKGVRTTTKVSLNGEPAQPVVGFLTLKEVDAMRPVLCSHGMTTGFACGAVRFVEDGLLSVDIPTAPGDSGAGTFARGPDGLYLAGQTVSKDGVGNPIESVVNDFGITWAA
ncbi:hypothetical protein [Gordonia malaquae]|uniref:hypothetical protein n=1 Tax=Gordonia malaquae TaxID=410332 RepID=UPI0030191568